MLQTYKTLYFDNEILYYISLLQIRRCKIVENILFSVNNTQ